MVDGGGISPVDSLVELPIPPVGCQCIKTEILTHRPFGESGSVWKWGKVGWDVHIHGNDNRAIWSHLRFSRKPGQILKEY